MTAASGGESPAEISVSDLVNFVFCPRRAWLEGQGDTVESADRVAGTRAHRTVDDGPEGRQAMTVAHRRLGLVGRPDVIRDADGAVQIVDYKFTARNRIAQIRPGEIVQLAAYRACLRDMGFTVSGAALWLVKQRRMLHVPDTDLDAVDLDTVVAQTRRVLESTQSPPVLVDDPRCFGCSQLSVCQPSEALLTDPRVTPPVPDGRVVYLDHTVSFARIHQGRMVLDVAGDGGGKSVETIPLEQVLGVVVFGNTTLSTPLLNWFGEHGKTAVMCSYTGRVRGWFTGLHPRNSSLRQDLATLNIRTRYAIMAEVVRAKAASQAALAGKSVRGSEAAAYIRSRIAGIADTPVMDEPGDPTSALFGIEGRCSKTYFDWYLADLPGWATAEKVRSRRPARDPVNAALNYGYGLLSAAMVRTVLSCGLDPAAGMLHSPSRNKPALVLDLMEQFRVPLVDQLVRRMINTSMLSSTDFEVSGAAVVMSSTGRKKLIAEFEKKMASTHRYLDKDRPLSWHRTMDHQVRQLLRILDGTQTTYRAVRVW